MTFQSSCLNSYLAPPKQPDNPILIWVDNVDPPKAVKDRLWRGCRCCRFRNLPDVISFMRSLDNDKAVLVIMVTAENCRFVLETLRNVCLLNDAERYPSIETFLILAEDTSDEYVDLFRSMGAEVRFRLDPEDAEKCIQYLRRRLIRQERQAVFEFVYIDAKELKVYLRGPRGRSELEVGERLKRTIEILAERRVIPTRLFSNELGVSVKTPKKYMDELRNEYNRMRAAVGETIPGKNVFVSQRLPGGWVHRFEAKVIK